MTNEPVSQLPATRQPPALSTVGLSKSYGRVKALRSIDMELYEGEILALVGDNGAGKSTLMKILSGAVAADEGEILMDGVPVHLTSPIVARRHGIETVHQDLAVVPTLDVTENLFLGREIRIGGPFGRVVPLLNKRAMRRAARDHLQTLNIGIPSVRQRTDTLSGGQRQAVAVARAYAFGHRIVIMDEPTAALGVQETEAVVDLIRKINEQGIAVILVSHNLPQVLELSNRIMVLRAGMNVGTVETQRTDMEQVVRLITGAEVRHTA
ncbi:MAG: sugar transporter ATP-binding protein [Acidimicrobiaceae bacterium]|nr:sugar transporter ATP-binding protein [Acidimicrobiaceae bacterium]